MGQAVAVGGLCSCRRCWPGTSQLQLATGWQPTPPARNCCLLCSAPSCATAMQGEPRTLAPSPLGRAAAAALPLGHTRGGQGWEPRVPHAA